MTAHQRASPHALGAAILLLILGVTSWTSVAAQAPPSSRDQQLTVQYRRLVDEYRRGKQGVVALVAAMPSADVEKILNVIFSASVPDGPWTAAELEVAAGARYEWQRGGRAATTLEGRGRHDARASRAAGPGRPAVL